MSGITSPGFYDLSATDYHADPCPAPSLSSSIALELVERTPAHAWALHPRLNAAAARRVATEEMDLGSVAHELLLGAGGGYVVSPHAEYRTKEAKAWRDEVLASGAIPIKQRELDKARLVAEGIRERVQRIDGCAGAFVHGKGEVAMLWQDEGGVWCRGLLDWLMPDGLTVYDLKTTSGSLSDAALAYRIADGLDVQLGLYVRGLEALRPEFAGRFRWAWVFAETKPPHEVRVIEADGATMTMGAKKADYAVRTWRRCIETGDWPGYARRVDRIEYPARAEAEWLAREIAEMEAA